MYEYESDIKIGRIWATLLWPYIFNEAWPKIKILVLSTGYERCSVYKYEWHIQIGRTSETLLSDYIFNQVRQYLIPA